MILKQINKEIEDFQSKNIHIVPGLLFNQHDTIETIFYYYNSKYKTGDIDSDGDRKYFFNINKNPCKVFTKSIDFDTKHIRLLTTGGGDPTKTWFMERDLQFWMRDKQFGKTLNRMFTEIPIFGTVVLKIIDGAPHFVDLRNFVVEQSAETLDSSNYINEIHNYTPTEFRAVAKKMPWKKSDINDVIDLYHEMKDTSHIRVYERYGEVSDLQDNGETTYSNRRVFVADVGVDEYDQKGELVSTYTGVELSSEEWTRHPYREFHAEKMAGRWLGIGVVETLLEPQIRQNEIANLQTKTSYWAALRLFQTRDDSVNRNLLTDASNGEILNVDSEITQIDMSDRNLAFFNEETRKWLSNRDELTFSFDVVQGERLPAGTPLGSAKIAAAQTMSHFDQIQESIALDVKEMLFKDILPEFEKDMSDEHVMRLIGEDLDTYSKMVTNELVAEEIMRLAVEGSFPTEENKKAITIAVEESIKSNKERLLDIPKGFYKDIKYDVDIDITGESVDTQVRYATKFALLQAMTADPTMTTDPVKRKMLFSMAEDGGVNPAELFGVISSSIDEVAPPEARRAGGGVSAPSIGQSVPGQVSNTI